MSKHKLESTTSPKGRVRFAHLDKPNTKFKPDGEYSCEVILTEDDARPLIEKLNAAAKAAQAQFIADAKTPAEKKKIGGYKLHVPIKANVDRESGEDIPGEFVLSAKAGAAGKRKDGTPWTFRPVIVDAHRNPMKHGKIGGGSIVRVSFTIRPFCVAGISSVGVSASLDGVQVIDLKSWGSRSASDMFGVEDGFDATAEDTPDNVPPPTEGGNAEAGADPGAGGEESPF